MKTKYTHLDATNQLVAERSFAAPKSKVWKYYTTAELLDKWWGPEPYKAITESMDFTPGGQWRYVMSGPDGDAHHCINDYKTIDPQNSFSASDAFANPDWSINTELPTQDWDITFTEEDGVAHVKVVITFKNKEDLATLVKMGMKEGFNQGLDQLEALLSN